MIEPLIEVSLRNRFLVVACFALLGVWGYWALLTTPIDTIPDLSEKQGLQLLTKALPAGLVPTLGPDATGVGHLFWYTVESPSHFLRDLHERSRDGVRTAAQ